MIGRTDTDGRWESDDGGATWCLVEPSQAWRDAMSATAPADPDPAPVLPLADEVEAARALLLSSTTNSVLLTKQRAAALDDLRGQQLAALLSPET